MRKLRYGLNNVDGVCDVHGHHTVALDTFSVDGEVKNYTVI